MSFVKRLWNAIRNPVSPFLWKVGNLLQSLWLIRTCIFFLFVTDSLCRSGPWRYVFVLFTECFFYTQLCIELSVGNRFYERPSPNGKCSKSGFWEWCLTYFYVDSTRTSRRIEYRDPEDVWKYTGGGKRLPSASHCHHRYLVISKNNNGTVQWSAWLAHTRLHPPTIEVRLFLSFPIIEDRI